MTRPRAADDFAMIRARMEELHRERGTGPGGRHGSGSPSVLVSRPSGPAVSSVTSPGESHRRERRHRASPVSGLPRGGARRGGWVYPPAAAPFQPLERT